MNFIDYAILSIASSIIILIHTLCYGFLSNIKTKKYSAKVYLIIIVSGILIVINTYFNEFINRAIVSYLVMAIVDYIIFRDTIKNTIIKSLLSYIMIVLFEIVLSVFIMFSPIVSLEEFDSNVLIKTCFSLLTIAGAYLVCKTKALKKLANKIIKACDNAYFDIILLIITSSLLVVVALKNTYDISNGTYFSNLVLLICFAILIVITIYNNFRAKKVEEKKDTLLEFMSKYEKMIDDDRINIHEILNNLIILKSFKNKNTKKFEDTLDDIIAVYNKKNGKSIKNIYNLPAGLKGVIYYKVNDMKSLNIDPIINISKNSVLSLEKISRKNYYNLCKIVGILIDNAIDAAKDTEDKLIIIDIYKLDNKTIISIENSFSNSVNLDKINELNYSSKGKNRGLGLYIAKRLLIKSKLIQLHQSADKTFISKLTLNI